MRKPDNYLVWAILTTVLCCLPFGVVAIVKASKVDSLWAQELHEEAIQASNDAKKWSIIGAVCGFIGCIIYFVCMFIVGFASAMGEF